MGRILINGEAYKDISNYKFLWPQKCLENIRLYINTTSFNSNTTGLICGAGIANSSAAPEFTPCS